ncbi:T9SS type A sorting domain-containing protein [Owenweeksia hongkongensis]|uniref:T9SS type A sorting domain-containing protein n=1 Tax=Owenweeksia hongkongensis TaxID=253245 RepID=UPI003A903A88
MRNTITFLASIILIFNLSSAEAQTTFDWENAIDNDSSITQTVNGVTATFTVSSGEPMFLSYSSLSGCADGWFTTVKNPGESYAKITFSQPINVSSICAFDLSSASIHPQTYIFTPTGGSNAVVNGNIPPVGYSYQIDLNWTNVTSITVTCSNPNPGFGLDNIQSDYKIGINEYQKSESQIEIYPNPSSNFIQLSNLYQSVNYKICNTDGGGITKGTTSSEEMIDIRHLTKGLYLLMLQDGSALKFIKE